ncbi:VanZ family protein [Rathayibacter sp. VKM Ac-2803]|uniref:VanZ family protein n=1 Tax=unclassified Rathayibacter TaxID=2609250 RepID=UPI00135B5AD1|nr:MULTISPECIES: VanZ family protein [unclassified Rathayibacter]MWV51265.1 VanZ family protein [Rathayibacter sp. VKM Ac-2803]MWV57751.1 VanZ family protein [Rathayibacter sp. VKM Ac-2754]
MISTILVENAALVRVLFWVAIAASAVLGWLLVRAGRSRALSVLAALALVAGLAVALSPEDNRAPAFCTVQFSVPFQGLDTLANIAMLLPLTLFAALRIRRPVLVAAAVSGLSALIELVQALLPDLGRSCDTDDWFMNTVGALVGAVLAAVILLVESRR